jgi:hypothetical protein
MGCLLVLFRKHFAKMQAGFWGQKYTDSDLKYQEKVSVIGGVLSFIIGILRMIGIIRF